MNSRAAKCTRITVAAGDAPWLVMVHGATHSHRYFGSQARAFENDFRLLLIDLPGHGLSADLPGPYGFEEYADSVLAALDAAGIEATHYIGTHTGSACALILAARSPERFLSLALEGPPLPGADLPSVIDAMDRCRATARERGGRPGPEIGSGPPRAVGSGPRASPDGQGADAQELTSSSS